VTRRPRYEIVRTDAGWHARFRASNGRIVWTTEVYTRRRDARNAIALLRAFGKDAKTSERVS
jgi:uncharacterized protein YegP (UPF0339 family)